MKCMPPVSGTRFVNRLLSLLLVGVAWCFVQQSALAQDTPSTGSAGTTGATAGAQVAPSDWPPRLLSSIVRIDTRIPSDALSAETLGAARSGTGVLIESQLVLTIGYLLLEADQVMITSRSGKRIPGSVAGYDHETGLGLIRSALPLDGEPMTLGDSDGVSERQRVLTVGQGEANATELLVVSRRPFTGSWEYLLERPIFTFPPVNNWSGSALISESGLLVGVGSLILNNVSEARGGIPGNLFVPINLLKPIFADLLQSGRRVGHVRPWLGVTTEMVRGRLLITRVTKSGPADLAGVQAGDVIDAVDANQISDQADFYRRVWQSGAAGVVVGLRLTKAGETREVPVKSMDRMDFVRKPTGV